MTEDVILIVTNEELKRKINIVAHKIEILKTKENKELITRLNQSLHDTYKYIVFVDGCISYKELTHYIPINCVNNCQNKIFVNEIAINSIIIDNIKNIDDDDRKIIELAVILKHLLKINITPNEFDLDNEIENIRMLNNFKEINNVMLKKDIYITIKQHYSQGDFFRKINYELKKNKIIKMFLFKTLENIIEDIKKNTNGELVFKELVSIIV